MKEDKFITLHKFNSLENAQELIYSLKKNGVKVQIEDTSPPLDITFSGNTLQNEVRIKVKQSDLGRANQILEKQAEQIVDKFPNDYYLYDFTDNELVEIIEKSDEWSKEDFMLSQKILKDRGKEISKEKIEKIKQKRIDDLKKPEKGHIGWLIFGFISAILGGLLGIFIGWFHWSFKKTVPTGQQVYAYDQKTRKQGQIIFLIGIVATIYWIYWTFR
ncbi:MAG: hypothetical protein CMD02_04000 [Flavobacteriales bacterium]|nr:hypothetical protein [Flavobacteriales bacterium]